MSVRKVCECSVLRVALVVWTLTLGGAGAAEETGGRTLPAEDQATVDAYLDWAAFLRLQHDASTATAMEDRAGTLRKASRTPTSLTIGFDPYRELQDYASALEAAGDAAKARRVQDVAQAYREEQVLRLTMHGGKVLDPWRYMGRPRNYERQLPGMLEARYSLRGPGFLANHPPGADWVMETRGTVRPLALLNYLQDSAGEHAGRLGWSVIDLLKKNMTWVLSRYHIRFHRYPGLGRHLEVTTWPSGKSGFFATRDFEVADGDGPVLSATSSWMIIGLEKKQPLKVEAVIDVPYAIDRRALDDPFPSLPVPAARETELRFRVESGHLVWNRHVNNAVYVQWALEAVPPDVLLGRRTVDIVVSYRAEALFGDEVLSVVQRLTEADGGPAFLH